MGRRRYLLIFRLDGPNPNSAAETWDTLDSGGYQYNYQNNGGGYWPWFGGGGNNGGADLYFGTHSALGVGGTCNQGTTYEGNQWDACGGGIHMTVIYGMGVWGETDMEMWYMADEP